MHQKRERGTRYSKALQVLRCLTLILLDCKPLPQNHWFNHDAQMPVESIAQSVSNLAIQFGDSDSDGSALSRPFGVALLFAGCDPDHGPQLFHMDPSGTYVRYDAKAIFLPNGNEKYNDESLFLTSGWGKTRDGGHSSDLLLSVTLPFVPHGVCKDKYFELLTPQMMCAGDIENGKIATCGGDSGGKIAPL